MKHLLAIGFIFFLGVVVKAQDPGVKIDTNKTTICLCCGGGKYKPRPSPMFVFKVTGKTYLVDSLSLNAINPDDIENIDVIKDTEANKYVKYGDSAKNGVILVTIKDEEYPKIVAEIKSHVIKEINL